jgi:alkanesulfonate monooxygenase SsuD/methylene tetrahydromethanopterin reductase-like flavin-dependent oxidoreductase (luciferase family)
VTEAGPPVGLVLGSALAPEDIKGVAARGEQLGFGQLWLAEDYFYTGGVSGAAAVLGATERVSVGLGVVSAMVRHPSLLAMELSTLERMYPGRLVPGIGLGLPNWVAQMGLTPRSSLRALRECVTTVRALLDGEELTTTGDYFSFDAVKLTYPVLDRQVPLYTGVVGPKMLQLSGEIADGTILSVLASPQYVEWARERIAEGAKRSGRDYHHRISTFALFAVDEDGDRARRDIRPLLAFYLEAMAHSALVQAYGITDRVLELAAEGTEALAAGMPDEWIEDLAIAGDPAECAQKVERLLEAGSDTVELFPVPPERASELLELAGEQMLPRITTSTAEAV